MDQREFTRITMVVLTGRREVGVAVGWLKWEKKERGVLFFSFVNFQGNCIFMFSFQNKPDSSTFLFGILKSIPMC